jgi:hypothetical protein
MKRNFLILAIAAIFTLSAATLSAQTPFFLNSVGAEAEYAIKGPDGAAMAYSRSVVKSIEAKDDANYTITYTTEALSADHMQLATPVTTTAEVKDGTVSIAPSTGGMEGATLEGTFPSYPADMAIGQTFEYAFTMKIMGMTADTRGRDTVVAQESVTTAAGTFDCFKIESEVTVNAMMQSMVTKVVTWISAGVGNVKAETYMGGKLQMTQELVSLKK